MVAVSGNGWRLAPSLVKLVDDADRFAPARSRRSDGSIGDAAHANRPSDHNPADGWVHAVDLTHDPDGGFDSYAVAEQLRQSRDPRIRYVISNGRIFSSSNRPFEWRPYTGANRHDSHVHVSITRLDAARSDISGWPLGHTAPPDFHPVTGDVPMPVIFRDTRDNRIWIWYRSSGRRRHLTSGDQRNIAVLFGAEDKGDLSGDVVDRIFELTEEF
jgi:hypothetical protein